MVDSTGPKVMIWQLLVKAHVPTIQLHGVFGSALTDLFIWTESHGGSFRLWQVACIGHRALVQFVVSVGTDGD